MRCALVEKVTALYLQQVLLGGLSDLLKDYHGPLISRRMLRNELAFGLKDVQRIEQDRLTRWLINRQMAPLVNVILPVYPVVRPVVPQQADRLKQVICEGDIPAIRQMIASGELMALIPEWRRVVGPDNYQHFDQDYTLDEHHLNALANTQASPHYQRLSPEEKLRVSTAAFFHDIDKHTGPKNFREALHSSTGAGHCDPYPVSSGAGQHGQARRG
jgi:hypothetical protein